MPLEIPAPDLEWETYPPVVKGGQHVGTGPNGAKVTHLPTGLVAISTVGTVAAPEPPDCHGYVTRRANLAEFPLNPKGFSVRFGSVCSGIEAASVAWQPLGWRCAFASEIEPFPRAVLAHRHPATPLHGDFTSIKAGDYEPIDILVGGTPCQSFSVAGLRGGMADARGNLALEYLRLAGRLRPRWLVWENVPGVLSSTGGRDFGAFLGGVAELGYGWAYRMLDAQHFGLAQRRKRVFVVGYIGDWRRAAAVLFEPASLCRHPAPRRHPEARVAGTITGVSDGDGWRCGADEAAAGHLIPEVATALQEMDGAKGVDSDCTDTLLAFGGNNTAGPIEVAATLNACKTASGRQDFKTETFVVGALCANGKAAGSATQQDAEQGMLVAGAGVRRMTPRECERLQGFPDDYTLIPWRKGQAPDGPRYKALGNSMAVPVMRWIGQRISSLS